MEGAGRDEDGVLEAGDRDRMVAPQPRAVPQPAVDPAALAPGEDAAVAGQGERVGRAGLHGDDFTLASPVAQRASTPSRLRRGALPL